MFAPKEYFDMYPRDRVNLPVIPEDDLDDVPPQGKEFAAARRDEFERIVKDDKWRDMVQAYLACITFADMMVGRVLQFLSTSPYASNTVVVFWSDNGWHLGEKRHVHKSTLWQRSTHVPLIIAGPQVQKKGEVRTQPASLVDLYPTLLDLCGLPANTSNDGVSLKTQLLNAAATHDPVVTTYWPGNHSVRDKRWRYTRYHDGSEELFDEVADKNEFHNIAANPGYSAVKQKLARYMPANSATPVPERSAYDFNYEKFSFTLKKP